MHTQFQLATLKKGSESISDYYKKAKTLASSLGAVGHSLSDQEFSIYLLAGLGTDYESLVTSLTTKPDPLSPHQLYRYLLNHESRLSHQTQSLFSGTNLVAHNTTVWSPTAPSSGWGCGSPFCGGRRGCGFGRGGARGVAPTSNYFNNSSNTVCQVCHKSRHLAVSCYHRFNHAYQTPSLTSLATNFTALPTPQSSTSTWFPDKAATHHFISEFTNLNLDSVPHQGFEQVSIRNGSTLPIQNQGLSQLTTTSSTFLLHNLLHVPLFPRNILSIRQFCQDKLVFFEFHHNSFIVKDSLSWAVFL